MGELIDPLRLVEAAEHERTAVDQAGVERQDVPHQPGGVGRQQDLAAVGGGADAGRLMHGNGDVVDAGVGRATPVCRPMRTRTSPSSGQSSAARLRWASRQAPMARPASAKTANMPSPSVFTSTPSKAPMTARSSRRCVSRTSS